MNKIRYDPAAQTVICKTKMVAGPNRNFEILDPLVCPDCGGAMRIVAFVEDQRVVCAILTHLSLWDEPRPPPATPTARHTAIARRRILTSAQGDANILL